VKARRGSGQLHEPVGRFGKPASRFLIGREIFWLFNQKKPALSGLGIGDEREDIGRLVADLARLHRFIGVGLHFERQPERHGNDGGEADDPRKHEQDRLAKKRVVPESHQQKR
jgi:hypothetical protein